MSGAEVSWKAIEKGARVVASDGEEIGKVAEIAGDSEADIFSGLVVSMSRLGRNRFLPAEQLEEYSDPVAERWQPSEGGFLSRIFRRRR